MQRHPIEKNSIQETLVIPLYGRALCTRKFPQLFADQTAAELLEQIDYDFSALEQRSGGLLQTFGALEGAYLDLLYVLPDCQGRGVGSALCGFLEHLCPESRITVHASRTARPFFEAQGYRLVRSQQVERRGVMLENFVLEKDLA